MMGNLKNERKAIYVKASQRGEARVSGMVETLWGSYIYNIYIK